MWVPEAMKRKDATRNSRNLSQGMIFTTLVLDDSSPEVQIPFGVLAAQLEEVAADLGHQPKWESWPPT